MTYGAYMTHPSTPRLAYSYAARRPPITGHRPLSTGYRHGAKTLRLSTRIW